LQRLLPLLPYLCFFAAFYALLLPIGLRGSSDDTAHIGEIEESGVLEWVKMRAATWQPRYLSDTAFALLLFRLPLWRVLNAAIMAVLLWTVCRVATLGGAVAGGAIGTGGGTGAEGAGRKVALAAFTVLLLFTIHPNVVTSGSVWYTGSFYYLWPTTAMLLGLMPFLCAAYGRALPFKIPLTAFCVLCSVCAAFVEQTMAVQIGLALLTLLFLLARKEKPALPLIGHFLLMLVIGAVFLWLDFRSTRVTGDEELQLFPAFADFSPLDKLVLGVNVYDTHLLFRSNILFLILALAAALLAFRNTKAKARFLLFLPAAWALANALPLRFWVYTKQTAEMLGRPGALPFSQPQWMDYLYETAPVADTPTARGAVLAVLGLLCVLGVFYPLCRAFEDVRERFVAAALYLAAFVSGIIIGFSPTVWASESRPNFVSNFLLLILVVMCIRRAAPKPGTLAVLLPALGAFAVFSWTLYHTVFATNVYWWY
jgi:hypothetical protein